MVSIIRARLLLLVLLGVHEANTEDVIVAQQRTPSASSYCPERKCWDLNREHIVCEFKDRSNETFKEGSSKCRVNTFMTEQQRGRYLSDANKFRNSVAGGLKAPLPIGANIKVLKWDYELERFARILATNPEYVYNELTSKLWYWFPCASFEKYERVISIAKIGVFATLANAVYAWTSNPPGKTVIKEFKVFKSNDSDNYINTWTALAWAESDRLGCAKSFPKCEESAVQLPNILICLLAVGGNDEGKPVYEEGIPCSKCLEGYDCVGKGNYVNYLCKAEGDPDPSPGPIPASAAATGPSLLVVTSLLISQQ